MKIKAIMAVAALALTSSLNAFTLDFSSSVGKTIPKDLIIHVAGYGDVMFSAAYNAVQKAGSTLKVGTDHYNTASLQFDGGDTVKVTFLGALPDNVDFANIAISGGENFFVMQTGPNEYTLQLLNSTNGAGVTRVDFTTVIPEPSAALLGVLGSVGLLVRRRR